MGISIFSHGTDITVQRFASSETGQINTARLRSFRQGIFTYNTFNAAMISASAKRSVSVN